MPRSHLYSTALFVHFLATFYVIFNLFDQYYLPVSTFIIKRLGTAAESGKMYLVSQKKEKMLHKS
jgi:hypothetical protein